jgi:hypothetical protein
MRRRPLVRCLAISIAALLFLSAASEISAAGERKETSSKKKWVKSKYGIKALLTLSKDRGQMEKEYRVETDNYQKIRKAIECGRMEKGEASSEIRKRYGDPVVDFAEDDGKVYKWVYKPGNVTLLEKQKIYLFFDENEKLTNWQMMEGN